LMMCKLLKDGEEMPSDAVCKWIDEGETYYLQKRAVPRTERTPEGDSITNRLPGYAGPSRGVWTLSPNVFCKAKSWNEGLITEPTTIRWINKNVPSVPTEPLLYDWIDAEWNRSVMISKRIPGKTYLEAWPDLTRAQKLHVADQVAIHQKALSEMTSDYVETVQGTGVPGCWSLRLREDALPQWKHRIEPRVHRKDYEAFEKRNDENYGVTVGHPGIGEPLVLQHPSVTPEHVLVTTPSGPEEMPKVTGITDWGGVGT